VPTAAKEPTMTTCGRTRALGKLETQSFGRAPITVGESVTTTMLPSSECVCHLCPSMRIPHKVIEVSVCALADQPGRGRGLAPR
jgi:hypothetical protein